MEERYQQLVVELPVSLYSEGFTLRLRAASYLNDSRWTPENDVTLPCSTLLGSGTAVLPCQPFDAAFGSGPEPKILLGEYEVPESGPERDAYDVSLLRSGVPFLASIRITIQLPVYSAISYQDSALDAMGLRSPEPDCLFTQVEWSPDANFARLFVGARPACAVPGSIITTTIDNFAENLDSLNNSIFLS